MLRSGGEVRLAERVWWIRLQSAVSVVFAVDNKDGETVPIYYSIARQHKMYDDD